MFARITPYWIKPRAREAATQQMHEMKADIMAQPGITEFINVQDENGHGFVITIMESREAADANAHIARELWDRMHEHLSMMPTPTGHEVIAHWKK